MLKELGEKYMSKVRIPTKRHHHIEVTETKSTITDMKNAIEGFNSELMKQKEQQTHRQWRGAHPIRGTKRKE